MTEVLSGNDDFERAIESVEGVFKDINLAEGLPQDRPLRVGLLEAGIPIEAWSLHNYLIGQGRTIGQMTAYDTDKDAAGFTKLRPGPQGFEYVIGDLTQPDTLSGEYDLLVTRKPLVDRPSLERVFTHAFAHLAPQGKLVVTAVEGDFPFIRPIVERLGDIKAEQPIQRPKVSSYFVEERVVVAGKPRGR